MITLMNFAVMSDEELFIEWNSRCDINDIPIRLEMIKRGWIDNHGNRLSFPTHLDVK